MITSLFSLTWKGKAARWLLCAPVSRSSCCLLSHPATLLSDGHHGRGRDGSWWAEPALHHPAGQLRTSGLPRLHSAAYSEGVPGQRGSHQVNICQKRCIESIVFNICRIARNNTHDPVHHARYEASMRALLEVTSAMQGGQWEEAMELYTAAKSAWQELRKNHDLRWHKSRCLLRFKKEIQAPWTLVNILIIVVLDSHQEKLPVFLRSFTTGWAYTRILSRGVEILQRLRRYEVFWTCLLTLSQKYKLKLNVCQS